MEEEKRQLCEILMEKVNQQRRNISYIFWGKKIENGEFVEVRQRQYEFDLMQESENYLKFKLFSKHSSDHMKGDKNPLRRYPDKNPMYLYPNIFKGSKNPRWDHSISIEDVVKLKDKGLNQREIAEALNTTTKIVKKRLELANNHKVKDIEFVGYEDVYCGSVDLYNNFVLEFIPPNELLKPSYLTIKEDKDKPVSLNLNATIGYKLDISSHINIIPFYRYSGYYNPKFIDILKFQDPYITKKSIITGENDLTTYESNVYNLVQNYNTQFNVTDENFGKIKNIFYHKINSNSNSKILELSKNSNFKSLYPLINETGIGKRDTDVFKSTWDPDYYIKSITKSISEKIPGTINPIEHKSFFGSKLMKTPKDIEVDTFTYTSLPIDPNIDLNNLSESIFYTETNESIFLTIDLEKRLYEYLYDDVYNTYIKYVEPMYSYGTKNNLDDDIKRYIKYNILPRYQIEDIQLYVKQQKIDGTTDYQYLNLDNTLKLSNGLKVFKNFSFDYIKNSNLNINLIYNKILTYKHSIGLSIKITRK
jgi:hypothetical protein